LTGNLREGRYENVTVIGFHASHEQLHPTALLDAVQQAEQAGFTAAMCSDHFAPWSERQGHSAFAWAWLGAALQATSLPFGVVNAPGQRYHPAIIAQAIGTLEAMFPGRFWAALGSGEAVNEHVTGDGWPSKDHRNARLEESTAIIRSLLAGDEVSHDGEVTVDRAKLWTLPAHPPPLLAAAVSPQTAAWAAGWADGLATVLQAPDALASVIDAYRSHGGAGPHGASSAPELRRHRRRSARDRTRPVAHQRLLAAAVLGPRLGRSVRHRRHPCSTLKPCEDR
jgi:G6PDH family F420-dependent oxidoreductase